MAVQIWINGQWVSQASHKALQDIGVNTHAQIDIALRLISNINKFTISYAFADKSNGRYYKVISNYGSIGLEETEPQAVSAVIVIQDITTGTFYKVISTNGKLGLEVTEITTISTLMIISDYSNGRFYKIVSDGGLIGLEEAAEVAQIAIGDAPNDGKLYVRRNAVWEELVIA